MKAARGVMYDRNFNQLVKNIPSFSLAVIPVDLPKKEDELSNIINKLSSLSGKTEEEIRQLIKSQPFYSYQPIIIKDNLDFDQAILTTIQSYNYPGVVLKTDSARQYLSATTTLSLSHVMGYLGRLNQDNLDKYLEAGYSLDDYIGKAGLELNYEDMLKGKKGEEYVEVDAFGQTKNILAIQKPEAGKNLILSLDLDLQKVAEEALNKVLKSANKKRGSVVILDPRNGEVLALVSLPAFDNNLFASGISGEELSKLINNQDRPLFNRSIAGEYPSGSTFKLIMAGAALQEKIINSQTGFNSVGGIYYGKWFFPDWKAGGHGWTNVIKALAESVNTFFYLIGGGDDKFNGLGADRIKKYAELFGLNKELGIDLPNEASGLIPDSTWKSNTKNEQWYIGDTYHMSIGQGDILVTPLQVATWTSVFANGGTLFRPHLLKATSDGEVSDQVRPEIIKENFIDKKNIDVVNQGLRQGVLVGSSRGLASLPVSVAAKTGTAEWISTKHPHAWVTAFAPYEKPEIVVTVLVEEGEEGSRLAVPVVRDIIDWWAKKNIVSNKSEPIKP
ncbi:MAG: penicillin-binding protein 2 [Patescibacteria group bacterium]|nr:penicillin-binding protein 2 [Patescibacteria group bacterium]